MHTQPSFLMSNDSNNAKDCAWYMNRVCESGVTKTSTSVLKGRKQRSMGDILGFSSLNCKSQSTDLVTADKESGLYAFDHFSSVTCASTKPWAKLFADDNEEMTLKDMQRSLRRGMERSLDKEVCIEPSSNKRSHLIRVQETRPSVDSETPPIGLELLLEDSTSNSSMSLGDDPAGISSSCDASRGLLQDVGVQVSKAGSAADLPRRQRKASMVFATTVESEVEDDEWTLQKWQQLYHKQHSRPKRLKKHRKVQQEFSESIGKVCLKSPPLASRDTDAAQHTASEVESTQIACFQDSSALLEIKENRDTVSSECKPHEVKARCIDELPTSECVAPGCSSQTLAPLLSHSTVRLELEDESEVVTSKASMSERLQMNRKSDWAFKLCNKVQSIPVSKSESSQTRAGIKLISQTPFRKACDSSDFYPRGAYAKLPGQIKKSVIPEFEGITSSHFPVNSAGRTQHRTSTVVSDSEGVCNSKPVASGKFRHSSCNKGSTSKPTEQLDGAIPLRQSEITLLPEQSGSQLKGEDLSEFPAGLNCIETLEIEEEQELQQKPAKIPCKRKAISPLSQEFLLKASKLGECGVNAETRGMKRPLHGFNESWVDLPKWEKNELSGDTSAATGRIGKREDALHRSFCHNREKTFFPEALQSNVPSVTRPCLSHQTLTHVQNTSLMLPNSPSHPQNPSKSTSTVAPGSSSPSIPAKGILRSCSQACQGPCGCEECASVRSRAERASEFSQRQMQDIEGLAVKLMKDLSTLRNIVEDRLIQSPSVKHQSPRPVMSLDQLKKATGNALETEETAKKWLVRMARDCNRYCKIMRMQGRKLTFADESGGKLCHVKEFHSEPRLDSTTGLNARPLEAVCSSSITQDEPAVEVAVKESEVLKAS